MKTNKIEKLTYLINKIKQDKFHNKTFKIV